MPNDRPEPGGQHGVGVGNDKPSDAHGNRALARIQQQGQKRRQLVAGAQHVGRTDVARTDLAQIAQSEQLGDDDAERHRAQQITAYSGDGMQEEGLFHVSVRG